MSRRINIIAVRYEGVKHMNIHEKYNALREYILSLGSAATAFSGGVDSTFLLKVSHDVLGDKAMTVTVSSCLFPERELNGSKHFCESNHIRQIIFDVDELSIEGFSDNPRNRCYLCKRALFSRIKAIALEHELEYVIEGSNLDDLKDYRPGMKAIDELGIKSPLRAAGLTKADIRELSRELGLNTWDKPSYACLASRFVYGERITHEKLKMIEHAEDLMLSLGFRQERVRIHGDIARIEIMPDDFTRIIQDDIRTKIYDSLKALGFSYVTLDLSGYRTGSMNEMIK